MTGAMFTQALFVVAVPCLREAYACSCYRVSMASCKVSFEQYRAKAGSTNNGFDWAPEKTGRKIPPPRLKISRRLSSTELTVSLLP